MPKANASAGILRAVTGEASRKCFAQNNILDPSAGGHPRRQTFVTQAQELAPWAFSKKVIKSSRGHWISSRPLEQESF